MRGREGFEGIESVDLRGRDGLGFGGVFVEQGGLRFDGQGGIGIWGAFVRKAKWLTPPVKP